MIEYVKPLGFIGDLLGPLRDRNRYVKHSLNVQETEIVLLLGLFHKESRAKVDKNVQEKYFFDGKLDPVPLRIKKQEIFISDDNAGSVIGWIHQISDQDAAERLPDVTAAFKENSPMSLSQRHC